jgi:hypothetical protein
VPGKIFQNCRVNTGNELPSNPTVPKQIQANLPAELFLKPAESAVDGMTSPRSAIPIPHEWPLGILLHLTPRNRQCIVRKINESSASLLPFGWRKVPAAFVQFDMPGFHTL